MQQQLLLAGHQSAIGGHSGAPATYQRLKAVCAWPRMKRVVTEFVQACAVCQQAKPERLFLYQSVLGRWSRWILLKACPSPDDTTAY